MKIKSITFAAILAVGSLISLSALADDPGGVGVTLVSGTGDAGGTGPAQFLVESNDPSQIEYPTSSQINNDYYPINPGYTVRFTAKSPGGQFVVLNSDAKLKAGNLEGCTVNYDASKGAGNKITVSVGPNNDNSSVSCEKAYLGTDYTGYDHYNLIFYYPPHPPEKAK